MHVLVAAQKAKEQKSATAYSAGRNYPYYLLLNGTTALARFLPDSDPENILGSVEQHLMKFPFGGIVNSDHDSLDDHVVTVPCMTTWGEKDRVLEDTRPLWRGDAVDKGIAKTYYKKVYRLMSGLICSSPIVEKQEPDSPIRVFKFGRQVGDVIDAAYMSDQFDYAPHSYTHGRDFGITRTQQGTFGNYSTSGFRYKERPLTDAELAVIEKHGLLSLVDLLGPKPDAAMQDVIWEMYQASRNGDPFDNAKWGNHFKAFSAGGFGSQAANGPVADTILTKSKAEQDEVAERTLGKLKTRVTSAKVAAGK